MAGAPAHTFHPAVEPFSGGAPGATTPIGFTGRYLMVMEEIEQLDAVKVLKEVAGPQVAMAQETSFGRAGGTPSMAELDGADAVLIREFNVAVVTGKDVPRLRTATSRAVGVAALEPERIVYSTQGAASALDPAFLAGFRAGVGALADALTGQAAPGTPLVAGPVAATAFQDDLQFTWGLHAIGAPRTAATGRGIRVAVLDSGIDAGHPDFATRQIVTQSFVRGDAASDLVGHGTHCAGTVAGAQASVQGRRYGVAPDVELFIGQVLGPLGTGTDAAILNAIAWAVRNRCHVISISLETPVAPGDPHSPVYERVAQRALQQGCLIVAAAGNQSDRPARIAPVSHPANCPSIVAVGAVGSSLQVASFSCGGGGVGAVDIAGPGVSVYSSFPREQLFRRENGTSMATPHVAGVAALLAEAQAGLRGHALWTALRARARQLAAPPQDVGVGLVQVP